MGGGSEADRDSDFFARWSHVHIVLSFQSVSGEIENDTGEGPAATDTKPATYHVQRD